MYNLLYNIGKFYFQDNDCFINLSDEVSSVLINNRKTFREVSFS